MLITFLKGHLFALIPQPKGIKNFGPVTYINQTNHQKKACIILMLALGFNFLLDDTELRSKVGLKFLLWEDTNQSKLLYIYYIYIYIYVYIFVIIFVISRSSTHYKIYRRRRSINRRILLGSIHYVARQWSE